MMIDSSVVDNLLVVLFCFVLNLFYEYSLWPSPDNSYVQEHDQADHQEHDQELQKAKAFCCPWLDVRLWKV